MFIQGVLCWPAHKSLTHRSRLSEMTHLKCLAVRTSDDRHVQMNHAMQHMGPTVLFAGLPFLAQGDAHCPWPTMAPEDESRHAGFLELPSRACQQDWRAALSLCSFTTVTVCAFYGTMQGPMHSNRLRFFVFCFFFFLGGGDVFFFFPPLECFPGKK